VIIKRPKTISRYAGCSANRKRLALGSITSENNFIYPKIQNIIMDRIEIDPKKLGGKPVIKGTRIPVYLILEMLANGMSIEEILREYPELTEEDIKDAIKYASQILSKEDLYEVPA
jgi:uncharacterized protein (DUF433 family)